MINRPARPLLLCCSLVVLSLAMTERIFAADPPFAAAFLYEARIGEGIAASEQRLVTSPNDQQTRAGLGVLRFFHAFEQLSGNLYEHGIRVARVQRLVGDLGALTDHPNPKKLSYDQFRSLFESFHKELELAERDLAQVTADDVTFPLFPARIRLRLPGIPTPIGAQMVLGANQPQVKLLEEFQIGFDRGDVHWLRGYCHLLMAWTDIFLAVDHRENFECSGFLFFRNIDSPHAYLNNDYDWETATRTINRPMISDIIAYLHTWRFPLKERQRMTSALEHLQQVVAQSRLMWKHYLAETDDFNEWIPNPQQTGVMQIKVTQEMVSEWSAMLDEADLILQGKKLLPFWRGHGSAAEGNDQNRSRGLPQGTGLNFRRIFTEPRAIDPFLWAQGSAATPYLEQGEITSFASREQQQRIMRIFGANFGGIFFWWN